MRASGEEGIDLSINLGWVLRQDSDPDGARSSFEAALRMSRRNGDRSGIAYASLGLACLAADAGDWHRAAVLHGVAQAFLDRTGQPWEELEARYRRDSLDQVRAHLGQEQLERAYAQAWRSASMRPSTWPPERPPRLIFPRDISARYGAAWRGHAGPQTVDQIGGYGSSICGRLRLRRVTPGWRARRWSRPGRACRRRWRVNRCLPCAGRVSLRGRQGR